MNLSNVIEKPKSKDILVLWKQFNDMAKAHGVLEAAFSSYEKGKNHWSFYYLYGNNYESVGQTLLEYCISEGLMDVVCSMEVSEFGMTAYKLEPKTDEHENEGFPRQATDEVVLHFSDAEDLEELEEKLGDLQEAEGYFKLIAVFPSEEEEQWEYKQKVIEILSANDRIEDETEYILLSPVVNQKQDVKWDYSVIDSKGNVLSEGRLD